MKIQCPQCGVNGSADDSYQGKKVKCPKCQEVFVAAGGIAPVPPQYPDPAETPAEEPAAPEALEGAGPAPAEPVVEDRPEVGGEMEAAPEPAAEPEGEPDSPDLAAEIDGKGAEDEQQPEEAEPPATPGSPAAAAPDLPGEEQQSPAAGFAESPELPPAAPSRLTEMDARLAEMDGTAAPAADGIERQPYGIDQEQCWQCGKKNVLGVPFFAKDGRLYCPDCVPAADATTAQVPGPDSGTAAPEARHGLTLGGVLKEAWAKTKGAKGPVLAGSAVMYLVLLALVAGGALLMPSGMSGFAGETIFSLIVNAVAMVFTAGLLFMGIRKADDKPISWNMVFHGFSMAGRIIVAAILQSLLVGIGFLLLVLPGIYLAVGYAMTIPLIIDRRMSPWQAMEASRRAIHRQWWKVAGIFLAMTLILMLSMVPAGLGLIWTWPMCIILAGVVYRALFGAEKKAGMPS